MQRKIQLVLLVSMSLIAGMAGAFAQGYDIYGNPAGREPGEPDYETFAAQPEHDRDAQPGRNLDQANHPSTSSTHGDVGRDRNNDGTLTDQYRRW